MTTELAMINESPLALWKNPSEVIAEARVAAVALKDILDKKKHKVMFNGEQYLEREDWGTVGRFYGCTVKTIETRPVQFGSDVYGWEAVAIVTDREGREVGRAESMCLSDEDNWGDVPVYEWQDELDENGKKIWDDKKKRYKGKKVQIGTRPKPQFQLRSMAQTRAEAKALKGQFSWVVVLAGYAPGVAEEMTGNETPRDDGGEQERQPVTQPQRASETQKNGNGNGLETVSGEITRIEKAKQEGTFWIYVGDSLCLVPAREGMKVGSLAKMKAHKKTTKKGDAYWVPQEFTVESVIDADTQEIPHDPARESQEKTIAPDMKDLFDNGDVTKASSLPARGQKDGSIGSRAAQRLYALLNQNKAKTGLTEEILKEKILATLSVPIYSLSDLPVDLKATLEKLLTGEEDWRKYVVE